MSIKKASDLHFKYVKNTTELREAFIKKCEEFGIPVWRDDDETGSYLEVFAGECDHYNEFEIISTDDLEPQSKELFMDELIGIPTETPEEKEALDSIESVGVVGWKNGDECIYRGEVWQFVSLLSNEYHGTAVIFCLETEKIKQVASASLSKLETTQQRKDRERLASAYDLYECGQSAIKCIGYEEFNSFKNDDCAVKFWLAIVDKTNYRKEPKS